MTIMKNFIPLYEERTFGDKLSATFDFIKFNFRFWLMSCVYLLLPLSLVQALALNGYMGGIMGGALADGLSSDSSYMSMGISYIGYIFFFSVGSLLLSSLMYAMMRYYRENDGNFEGVTLKDLSGQLKKNFWRGFRAGLLLTGLFILACSLVILAGVPIALLQIPALAAVLFVLFLAAAIAVGVPLSLTMPVCMLEDGNTAFGAIRRGFRLGWNTWGGTFVVILLIGLIVNVIQSAVALPWYIALMAKAVLTEDNSAAEIVQSGWYNFLYYILAVVQTFGSYLAMSVMVTALGYQYGSAAEKVDSMSVDDDIENFESI